MMEKIKRPVEIALSSLLLLAAALLALFYPVYSYGQIPTYNGAKIENRKSPQNEESKKTVFVMTDAAITY